MGLFDQPPKTNPTPQTTTPAAPQVSGGIFDRIANSEPSQSAVYPDPGLYPALYVDVFKIIRSRRGDDLFTAEFLILDSQVPSRPAGTKMTWQANMRHDAAPGNVKTLIAATMGVDTGAVDSQSAALAVGAENPCHGRLVRLEATMIETKAAREARIARGEATPQPNFTKCSWHPVSEEYQARAEDFRSEIFGN